MAVHKRAATIADAAEQFDRATLLRLGAWGCAAVIAVTVMVFAGRSDLGAKRLYAAYIAITASPSDPQPAVVGQLLARTADMERESRRLADTVRTLANERDRLALRLGLVEREMGDLTGSITRGLSGPRPIEVKPATPATPAPAAQAAPIVTAPATTEPKTARVVQTITVPPLAALNETSPAAASAPPGGDAAPATTASLPETVPLPAPRPSEQTMQGSLGAIRAPSVAALDPAALAPHPMAPANGAVPQPQAEARAAAEEPQPKAEIGLDLGPALTMARLRQRWAAFKAAHGPLAETMRPVVSLREIAQNKPAEMRLVVGPVADVHIATQLCAALQGSQFMCHPAVFDGQRLALK